MNESKIILQTDESVFPVSDLQHSLSNFVAERRSASSRSENNKIKPALFYVSDELSGNSPDARFMMG